MLPCSEPHTYKIFANVTHGMTPSPYPSRNRERALEDAALGDAGDREGKTLSFRYQ